MFNIRRAYQNCLAKSVFVYCLSVTTVCQAQITTDGTLSTEITTPDNLEFTINGGSRAGSNLFHSFSEFSVATGGAAAFNNASDIQNIISRVTGGFPSSIDGLIKTQGNANLFIINPKGIIFGPNAKLEIGGSFLASTADRIEFADGSSLLANASIDTPLLTVSAPIGLQYGEAKTSDRSITVNGNLETLGFQVQSGKTLALVGEDIFVRGGVLIAPEGRLELGSVSNNSFVSLTPVDTNNIALGWILGYDKVQNFRDIQLSDEAIVISHLPFSDSSSGAIQLQSRRLTITGGANVLGENHGLNPGGKITVKASESVEVSGSRSVIANNNFSNAEGGDIAIETKQLFVRDGGTVQAFTEGGTGEGGKLTIVAPESVEITGISMIDGSYSRLLTQTNGAGNAGTLQIATGGLIIDRGGQVSTSTSNAGTAGDLLVDATKSVEISGFSINGKRASALLSQSLTRNATGNGGNIQINTRQLFVRDGGQISVSSIEGSTGQGGNLTINVPQLIEVTGTVTNNKNQVQPSTLASESQGSSNAGNITIYTDLLNVRDGAEISVSSASTGNAGNLNTSARNISLDNRGKLKSTSLLGTGGGNISLQNLNSLILRRDSEISTSAGGEGNGGDIEIKTNLLTALENSKITATAIRGKGGNIRIRTQGLIVSPNRDSQIDASSDEGVDGVVEINRLENDPENALLTLPAEPVNISGLIAQGCSSGEGSIARRGSEFVVTGRGGLPPTPQQAISSDFALADLGKPIQAEATPAKVVVPNKQNNSASTAIVEAQGWIIDDRGKVILTASAPNVTPSIPWMKPNSCHNNS